ncbi:MAG: SlyX family protein [Treponemataceae bacterium]|nr:SlyX family protein [Treponemataceae bacterium]
METDNYTEERLTAVEMKLAYLEDFMNKLQNISVEHEQIIDRLTAENRVLKGKLTELIEAQEGDIPNRKPPHY